MYRQKFKYQFGPMILLWRLKFQRYFVLKLFVKNAFLLFKNETEKKFFLAISVGREAFYIFFKLNLLIYSIGLVQSYIRLCLKFAPQHSDKMTGNPSNIMITKYTSQMSL